MIVILMGVSGCGKSVIGNLLSQRLGCQFAEGDSYHPPANREKMRGGTPLTDEDRWPWLRAIASDIDRWLAAGSDAVVACSALKKAYRDILVGSRAGVHLVHLKGSYELIYGRLTARKHEYMPVTLLKSQFATLEEPTAEERPIVVDIAEPADVLVEEIMTRLPGGKGRTL